MNLKTLKRNLQIVQQRIAVWSVLTIVFYIVSLVMSVNLFHYVTWICAGYDLILVILWIYLEIMIITNKDSQ